MELEELDEDEEEMSGEHSQADWMMEQATQFMQGTLRTSWYAKPLPELHIPTTRCSQPQQVTEQPHPLQQAPLELDPQWLLPPQFQHRKGQLSMPPPLAGLALARKRRHKTPSLGFCE